jgi:hypothetical protein
VKPDATPVKWAHIKNFVALRHNGKAAENIFEAFVKRSGLICFTLLCTGAVFAQEAPQQQPAQQPTQPAQQKPEQEQPETQSRNPRMPPPPPKVVDVREPGETGWYIGLTGWLPVGHTTIDKGKQADFTDPTKFQLPGTSKGQPGGEIGIAAGLHNSIRISYMFAKAAGTTTAPNDLVIFSQPYSKGDQLSTSYKLSNYKISYEYLTWPYPVESRHFRLKTLWQVQYITYRSNYDAPVKSNTPDSTGALTSYEATGSKSYFTPTFGLGLHEYVARNLHLELNASGFGIPHRFSLVDLDASVGYRAGKIEVRAGARSLNFRSSARSDYYFRGNLSGAYVGVRWYSN